MTSIKALHNEAMDLALKGDIAQQRGEHDECTALYLEAYEKEREAALLADFQQNPEPGLSILFRSAASLAMQCGKYREAEQLIAKALSGNPTQEIADELRELLQDIYARRGKREDVIIYTLAIPSTIRPRFESAMSELGVMPSRRRSLTAKLQKAKTIDDY